MSDFITDAASMVWTDLGGLQDVWATLKLVSDVLPIGDKKCFTATVLTSLRHGLAVHSQLKTYRALGVDEDWRADADPDRMAIADLMRQVASLGEVVRGGNEAVGNDTVSCNAHKLLQDAEHEIDGACRAH